MQLLSNDNKQISTQAKDLPRGLTVYPTHPRIGLFHARDRKLRRADKFMAHNAFISRT